MEPLLSSLNQWAGRSNPRHWGTRIPTSGGAEKAGEFLGKLGFQLALLPTKAWGGGVFGKQERQGLSRCPSDIFGGGRPIPSSSSPSEPGSFSSLMLSWGLFQQPPGSPGNLH